MKVDNIISRISVSNNSGLYKFSRNTKFAVADQIKSIWYQFNTLFNNQKFSGLINNKSLLNEAGIDCLEKHDRIVMRLNGRIYKYQIAINDENEMALNIDNPLDKNIKQSISINADRGIYHLKGFSNNAETENVLEDILSEIEAKILRLKRKQPSRRYTRPYLPTKSEAENLEIINQSINTAPCSILSDEERNTIEEIKKEYKKIKLLNKKMPNITSGFNVRSRYKNYIPTTNSQHKIQFANIGEEDEELSMHIMSKGSKEYLDLVVTKHGEIAQTYIITDDGRVLKKNIRNLSEDFRRIRKNPMDYYTKSEIDNTNLKKYLFSMNQELKSFYLYMQNWLDKLDDFKNEHKNINVGDLTNIKDRISGLYDNLTRYNRNIKKILYTAEKRNTFKKEHNLGTESSRVAINCLGITPEGYNLRLSFPTIPNKRAMQILVMDGDSVKDTFYILDNKLLKFKAKTLRDRFIHYNRNLYFYSQEYIDNSRLYEYIELLENKLKEINKDIDIKKRKTC